MIAAKIAKPSIGPVTTSDGAKARQVFVKLFTFSYFSQPEWFKGFCEVKDPSALRRCCRTRQEVTPGQAAGNREFVDAVLWVAHTTVPDWRPRRSARSRRCEVHGLIAKLRGLNPYPGNWRYEKSLKSAGSRKPSMSLTVIPTKAPVKPMGVAYSSLSLVKSFSTPTSIQAPSSER